MVHYKLFVTFQTFANLWAFLILRSKHLKIPECKFAILLKLGKGMQYVRVKQSEKFLQEQAILLSFLLGSYVKPMLKVMSGALAHSLCVPIIWRGWFLQSISMTIPGSVIDIYWAEKMGLRWAQRARIWPNWSLIYTAGWGLYMHIPNAI